MRYHRVTQTLLKIEDAARNFFESIPFTHAFLAGVGVILFWRGVWELADIMMLDPIASILLGCVMLGGIGLFIHTFVGNAIIIKNVNREERLEKESAKRISKVERNVELEEVTMQKLAEKIDSLEKKIDTLNK